MRRLVDFPPLDAARVLVQVGLSDAAPDVRRSAEDTLRTLAARDEVARWLLKTLDHTPHAAAPPNPAAILSALLAAGPDDAQQEVVRRIAGAAGKSKITNNTLVDVADSLGSAAASASIGGLKRLASTPRFASCFALRRATVRAIAASAQPNSVACLEELLPTLYGEARADAVRRLTAPAVAKHGAGPAGPSYYGLQIHARRMVFVVDVSGSMMGARLQTAKRELSGVLSALPDNAEFGLVSFSHQVRAWQTQLTVATPANRQRAIQYVNYLSAGGLTAVYDALETAFLVDAEAIYLLSDGRPTYGKIVDLAAIPSAVARLNHYRRISIYTIGIAPGLPGAPLDAFLKRLAEENYGLYRRVEE